MLFAFDANGVEAVVLCVLACSALIAVIVAGFALAPGLPRPAPKNGLSSTRHPEELGLLALWRLGRGPRPDRPLEPIADDEAREVARS